MIVSSKLGLLFSSDFWKKQTDFLLLTIVICEVIHDPHKWVNVIFIALCFMGFLPQMELRKNFVFWVFLGGLYFFTKNGYPLLANHHFLIFYLLLSKAIHSFLELNEREETHIYRIYFSVIMLVAALYKLSFSEVMSGSVYYYMWGNNMIFEAFTPLFYEGYSEVVSNNIDQLNRLFQTNSDGIVLDGGPLNLMPFFMFYTWTAVVLELLLSFLFWTPWSRITHFVILVFLLLVPLATTEFTFLSLVSLLGLSQVNRQTKHYAWIYAGIILFYTSLSLY